MCQLNLFSVGIVEEVGPIGIGLHIAKLQELREKEDKKTFDNIVTSVLVQVGAFVNGEAANELLSKNLTPTEIVYNPGNIIVGIAPQKLPHESGTFSFTNIVAFLLKLDSHMSDDLVNEQL